MDHGEASGRILAQIDDDRVLRLERDLIRIPSTTFEEGEIADYLAEHMADIGLEVEMMEVANPKAAGGFTRQPVGRLGNVGDGNILAAHGVASLQYGPGDIRNYDEWPTPDERVQLKDLVIAAKAIAIALYRVCG